MSKTPALSLRGLSGGYHGESVVRDVTLSLPAGRFTAILGPNGCGKSTLLRLCAGLLRPFSGQVLLGGRELSAIPRKELARLVSVLPQGRPVPGIPAEALVAHGRFPYLGYPRRMGQTDRDKVAEAMALAGVTGYRHKSVAELSGGQRQKVYFAMVLAQDTPLTLLDEPATYLDLNHQLELMALISRLRDQGRTVAAVLHDLPQALEWADYLVVMEEGRLAGAGTPEEIFRQGVLEKVFGLACRRIELDGRQRYFFTQQAGGDG